MDRGHIMRKSRDPETRYRDNLRREQKALEEFAAHEIEFADDLLLWYRVKKRDIPDDDYRAAAFFKNREFQGKPGSLSLLFSMYRHMNKELPGATRENAFYLLAYRYKVYAMALAKGGYDG
jgi:hypothetical protein